jgi:hypothetical protein
MNALALFGKISPRLKAGTAGLTFVDALNRVVEVIFRQLHRKKLEIVKARFDGVDVESEPFDLPGDFRGLVTQPLYLVGQDGARTEITELPHGAEVDDTPGVPRHFYLLGARKMAVSPVPAVLYELDGWYFAHPGTLNMTSTIPWNGLMDDIIADGVVLVSSGVRDLREIEAGVDGILSCRSISPRRNKL